MTIVLYVDDKQSKRPKFMSSGHDDLLLFLLLLLLLSHQNIYSPLLASDLIHNLMPKCPLHFIYQRPGEFGLEFENWSNDFWLILPY
jgi:hypothetical protein